MSPPRVAPPSQQATSPVTVRAQACAAPAARAETAPTLEATATSVGTAVPVPLPQHCTAADARRPQVMSPPTPRESHFVVSVPCETTPAVAESRVELRPSWPSLFDPQHVTSPPSVTAQACPDPTSTKRARIGVPSSEVTTAGDVASPDPPTGPVPQQRTSPEPVTTQAAVSPTATSRPFTSAPRSTAVGVADAATPPEPQHFTSPSAKTAQAAASPTDTAVAGAPSATGSGASSNVPVPGFLPQHTTSPTTSTAHDVVDPAATETMPVRSWLASLEVSLRRVPVPDWSDALSPQHLTWSTVTAHAWPAPTDTCDVGPTGPAPWEVTPEKPASAENSRSSCTPSSDDAAMSISTESWLSECSVTCGATNTSSRPATSRGSSWSSSDGSDVWPKSFLPQHDTRPSAASAHVCHMPATTSTAGFERP